MKFLLSTMLLFSQSLWALGNIDLKNVNIDYKNGSGSAEFDSLKLGMGDLEVDVKHLHKIDVNYRNNAYEFTERFDNKTSATFRWKMTEGTDFFMDFQDNVIFKTYGKVDLRLGSRRSDIKIAHISLANDKIALEAKGLSLECSHPNGFQNPNDYLVHTFKACLINSTIKLTSLVSRQEEKNNPLISEDFDNILAEAKHPLAQKTGIDLDNHKTSLKDKQLVDQLDIKVKNGQMDLDMFIKVFSIPIRVEFHGPIRMLEKTKQVRVHVETFKVLGVNFSQQLLKMVTNFLKKYETKAIQVKYPYLFIDISTLYAKDY